MSFEHLLVFGALGATLFWWIRWGYLPNSQSSMIAPANLTSMASSGISHYKPMISICCINAGNPKINLPYGDGSYHPFIMIWGIVYQWACHNDTNHPMFSLDVSDITMVQTITIYDVMFQPLVPMTRGFPF